MNWTRNKDDALVYITKNGDLVGSVFRGALKLNTEIKYGFVSIVYGSYPNVWHRCTFLDSSKKAKKWVQENAN